ncbi:MAG TPA: nucleotidyltransferase family protein [Gemmataceae bacterium]|nr:nucleotidyltransferase family protein [Gemmataceae bacterium]
MRIFALLPAGGTSSRMGRPKLALPLGERTVLERVLDTVRSAHVPTVLVVLGPQVADLKLRAENAGARTLLLDRQTPDMRATVQSGLDWLDENERPDAGDAFLLLPSDHPALAKDVIEILLRARSASTNMATIWIPTYEGRRGHPALIGWNHVPGIRALPADQGLNSYLRAHARETAEVPCACADILCDLDTPADYERLLKLAAGADTF